MPGLTFTQPVTGPIRNPIHPDTPHATPGYSGGGGGYGIDETVESLASSREQITDTLAAQEEQYTQIQKTIEDTAAESRAAIESFRDEIARALDTQLEAPDEISLGRTVVDIEGVIQPMRQALSDQMTNMKNAYRSQVQVQAKQLDAAMGSGAFGGNSYRAQQAYQSSMNQLFNQTSGQIANITLQAEQNIMSSVSELTALQAEVDFQTMSEEARLNLEQDMRHRDLSSNREIALLSQMGNVASMTVEAGSVLTNNWLNLMNINNQTVTDMVRILAELDITEAGIRQQQSRDMLQAQIAALDRNAALQQSYMAAEASRYSATQQRAAAESAARAQEYVAEISARTSERIAEMELGAQGAAQESHDTTVTEIMGNLDV